MHRASRRKHHLENLHVWPLRGRSPDPSLIKLPLVYPHLYLLASDVGAGQHQSRGLVMATGAAEVEAFLDKADPHTAQC